MTLDRETTQLLLAAARRVEREGLTPAVLEALEARDVQLVVDWHPVVVDGWRATVRVGAAGAPLVVHPDAATAAAAALRAAVVHGVGGERRGLRPLPDRAFGAVRRTRRAK